MQITQTRDAFALQKACGVHHQWGPDVCNLTMPNRSDFWAYHTDRSFSRIRKICTCFHEPDEADLQNQVRIPVQILAQIPAQNNPVQIPVQVRVETPILMTRIIAMHLHHLRDFFHRADSHDLNVLSMFPQARGIGHA